MKYINYAFIIFALGVMSCAPSGFQKMQQSALMHKSSETVFPENIGSFKRTVAQSYDDDGKNIGVGYQIRKPDCSVTVTFFIYPKLGSSLNQEFEAVNDAIKQYNPTSRLISRKNIEASDFRPSGLFSSYEIPNGITRTYFFENSEDFIKYRITYPASTREKSEEEIEFFMQNFRW
jgi:hypothetical protein